MPSLLQILLFILSTLIPEVLGSKSSELAFTLRKFRQGSSRGHWILLKSNCFPGDSGVKNQPTNAGDKGCAEDAG